MSYRSPTAIYTCDRCGAGCPVDDDGKPPQPWRQVTMHSHKFERNDRWALGGYPQYADREHFDICPDCVKSLKKWLTLKQ